MAKQSEPKPVDEYLGDGVYASCDGYYIILDLRAQATSEHVCKIALEPLVWSALGAYVKMCDHFYKKDL